MKIRAVTTVAAVVSAEVEPPEPFKVNDPVSANWVVRKIIDARTYARHVKGWAEGELRRAEREEQFFLNRYGVELEDWAQKQIASGRGKSIELPAGTVGFRSEPPKLDVIDETRLIAWCRSSLPAALKIETHVLKSLVKDHLAATGECPDGANVTGGGQRFYIK